MKLSRSRARLVLLLSCIPIYYAFVFMAGMLLFMTEVMDQPHAKGQPPVFPKSEIITVLAVHMVVILFTWAMIAFYIVYIVKHPRFESNEMLIWILVVIFTGAIGQLVFWFMRLWPDSNRSVALPTGDAPRPLEDD